MVLLYMWLYYGGGSLFIPCTIPCGIVFGLTILCLGYMRKLITLQLYCDYRDKGLFFWTSPKLNQNLPNCVINIETISRL